MKKIRILSWLLFLGFVFDVSTSDALLGFGKDGVFSRAGRSMKRRTSPCSSGLCKKFGDFKNCMNRSGYSLRLSTLFWARKHGGADDMNEFDNQIETKPITKYVFDPRTGEEQEITKTVKAVNGEVYLALQRTVGKHPECFKSFCKANCAIQLLDPQETDNEEDRRANTMKARKLTAFCRRPAKINTEMRMACGQCPAFLDEDWQIIQGCEFDEQEVDFRTVSNEDFMGAEAGGGTLGDRFNNDLDSGMNQGYGMGMQQAGMGAGGGDPYGGGYGGGFGGGY